MSRKRNSPNNSMMESFFGILKSEMFYGYENNYKSLEDLEQAITNDIDYYNDKHIKVNPLLKIEYPAFLGSVQADCC